MKNSYDSTIFTMKSLGTHGYPWVPKDRQGTRLRRSERACHPSTEAVLGVSSGCSMVGLGSQMGTQMIANLLCHFYILYGL